MKVNRDDLRIVRVLHEDRNFVTFEMPKRDDVPMRLRKDDEGRTVGGDHFFTVLFVRMDGLGAIVWNPFAVEGDPTP